MGVPVAPVGPRVLAKKALISNCGSQGQQIIIVTLDVIRHAEIGVQHTQRPHPFPRIHGVEVDTPPTDGPSE